VKRRDAAKLRIGISKDESTCFADVGSVNQQVIQQKPIAKRNKENTTSSRPRQEKPSPKQLGL
jgi:hypothetical protein